MNTIEPEKKPVKGMKHNLYRIAMLVILAVITIIVATILSNVFGVPVG